MPSYDGSDDYTLSPVPMLQGELGGIGINPRQGGVVLDFIKNPEEGVGFSFGPSIRLRANRASQIKDPVGRAWASSTARLRSGPAWGSPSPRCCTARTACRSASTPRGRARRA